VHVSLRVEMRMGTSLGLGLLENGVAPSQESQGL
jgi:hypothetical protein